MKPPVLKPREVIALLERLGFRDVRQRGSHKQFRHPDGRVTTVPLHKGRDISHPVAPDRDEILKLPVADRLQLLDETWDSLAADANSVPVPDGHRQELDRRAADPSPTRDF